MVGGGDAMPAGGFSLALVPKSLGIMEQLVSLDHR